MTINFIRLASGRRKFSWFSVFVLIASLLISLVLLNHTNKRLGEAFKASSAQEQK